MSDSLLQTLKHWIGPTDEQLMWRVSTKDDPEAFAEIVQRWQGPLQRLGTRMTGSLHRSEDIAQEAFAKLFTHRKNYRAEGKFSTYLWRVALNLCYDDLRRSQRRPETILDHDGETELLDTLPSGSPRPDEHAQQQEVGEAVRRAVQALPSSHSAIVILRHYECLKFREIAEVLDLPESTVKTRMTEAMNMLARHLKRNLHWSAVVPSNQRGKPSLGRPAAQRTDRSGATSPVPCPERTAAEGLEEPLLSVGL